MTKYLHPLPPPHPSSHILLRVRRTQAWL